jgi:rare lipoprotein A
MAIAGAASIHNDDSQGDSMKTQAAAIAMALSIGGVSLPSVALAQAATAPAAAASSKPAELAAAPAPAPKAAAGDAMSGTAAWYGRKFSGRKTASGQRFNAAALTAAHPSLAFGSKVKVTNTKNKRSVVVVINDRGPSTPGRIIDVTQAAAQRLGFVRAGTAEVTLEVVGKK